MFIEEINPNRVSRPAPTCELHILVGILNECFLFFSSLIHEIILVSCYVRISYDYKSSIVIFDLFNKLVKVWEFVLVKSEIPSFKSVANIHPKSLERNGVSFQTIVPLIHDVSR